MDINRVKKDLGRDWSGYQEVLVSALSNKNAFVSKINNYLIENAGKQLRPVLSLLASRACGSANETSYHCAAVSEMIHTATLLHDDVADDGDLRRGVPTVKAVFGQAASILAGDYWLSQALDELTRCGSDILACFTTAVKELSVGELVQMEKAELLDTTIEDYYSIISGKTASLFIAAMKSGAISVSANQEQIKAITEYAYELGVAFQIRDDIFDYTPSMDTGKNGGADIKERKITLPLLCSMEASPSEEAQYIRESISHIENTFTKGGKVTPQEQEIIDKVNAFVQKYNGVAKAQAILEKHSKMAILALAPLPQTKEREYLVALAEYVGTREK
ncbi:MAG: polyprenyl synthetase family protein [Bacteroidales bacterium]|nr:polyprenyl synthetase family protein [Bacteroidales bacterium]